jgi:hypothetical protein
MNLLTFENAKTAKGRAYGYETAVMYLIPQRSPNDSANLCPWASMGCQATCLVTAGRGVFSAVAAARAARRALLIGAPDEFGARLIMEVSDHVRRSKRLGLTPALRLNGTSDIDFQQFPAPDGRGLLSYLRDTHRGLFLYDYTKDPRRVLDPERREVLVFSRHENNQAAALRMLADRRRVAVVFSTRRGEPLPTDWHGHPVVDGDKHDLVFLHHPGTVLGLRAKGRARSDRSGFVVQV